ncbi:conserved membrane hypothetical protein [uncultured delta proteobacterium]|uniref:Permease family protein n=1 Tax=uncultured delta proteobacterium TaxID=34034 RepID=A0A212JLC9_9DELT|nr:conserved membrane hypothetical protein [uncultured delta proteobacterium]
MLRDWRRIRPDGQESPYIPLGPFQLRLPGIHYKFEPYDYIQGLLMCAVCLSIIPILQETLGMPFEVALAIVVLNGFLYCWHTALGDPVVPGWITPAIPLIVAHVMLFEPGAARMHALIAFQVLFAVWCLFLGITGLGRRVIDIIPPGIKCGIILGAGVSAIFMVFKPEGGRLMTMPITISICALFTMFLMYNYGFRKAAANNTVLRLVANLGLLPAIVLAIIVAPIVGEATINVQWGFSRPDFATLWSDWVPWGKLGWPSVSEFVHAIPLVLATYIVVFGDVIQVQAILADGRKVRPDDPAEYSVNRTHLIVGIRNGIMGVFGPDISMCGPLWAAMHVVIVERWKKGRATMDTLLGGAASFRFGTFTGYLILPIVTITRAVLPAALCLTLLIQGFVSVYVGAREAKNLKDLGIGGMVAGALLARGSDWGFAVGIIACILIYGTDLLPGRKIDEPAIWKDQE